MTQDRALSPSPGITRGQWMALTAAILGWLFDGLEMGLFPLVSYPSMSDLLNTTDDGLIGSWTGIMHAGFLVGAATGGVLFGWLGDRIGRVRAMTLSVLAYSIFTGLCGFSQNVQQFFGYRFIAALGMGGEWSLGVSLVMEIWPNRSRAWLAGLIGAASNIGFMLTGILSLGLDRFVGTLRDWLLAANLHEETVSALVENSGWRLLMMIGALPALLTFFIRLFVPESERWQAGQTHGTTSHWATRDLLGVLIGATGPLTIIYLWANDHSLALRIVGTMAGLALAAGGYLYPAIRFLQRSRGSAPPQTSAADRPISRMLFGAGLSGVALIGTWGSTQWAPTWAAQMADKEAKAAATAGDTAPGDSSEDAADPHAAPAAPTKFNAKAWTSICLAIGAIVGTIVAALLGERLGRRVTYVLICVGSCLSLVGFYQLNDRPDGMFFATAIIVGGVTAAFYGWLPLYLPELFPTRLRATGQGFAFNFGRILAAIGALQAGFLTKEVFKGDFAQGCSIMSAIYLVGVVIIWFVPETKGKELPE